MDQSIIEFIKEMHRQVDSVFVRGIRAMSSEQQSWFQHSRDRAAEMGAGFVSRQIADFLSAAGSGGAEASRRLFELKTTLQVFERVLTLDLARDSIEQMITDGAIDNGQA